MKKCSALRTRTVAAASGLCLLSLVACYDRPALELPSREDPAPLGPGERCAERATPQAAPAHASCGTAAPSAASPARPLGMGYERDEEPLPERVAYLTFDDGPSELTPSFLDILEAKQVRATFFVNARTWVREGSDLDQRFTDASGHRLSYGQVLRRTLEAGHALGNHALEHVDLATLGPAEVALQLDENERLVNRALMQAGAAPHLLSLLRPPYGSPWKDVTIPEADAARLRQQVGLQLQARGLNVLWNVDSSDSREWAVGEMATVRSAPLKVAANAPSAANKTARVHEAVMTSPVVTAGQGAIILLHDTHSTTRDALPSIIDDLTAAGYRFETIEQLVQERWGKPSWALSPGPRLYDPCVPEREWGCMDPEDVGSDGYAVCGRMWSAWQRAGGAPVLGAPEADAEVDSGAPRQRFARGTLELRPAGNAGCDVVVSTEP